MTPLSFSKVSAKSTEAKPARADAFDLTVGPRLAFGFKPDFFAELFFRIEPYAAFPFTCTPAHFSRSTSVAA
jgi:hypothetical protein